MNRANSLQIFYIGLLLLLTSFIEVHAQTDVVNVKAECEVLIDKADKAWESTNYSKALEYYTKAEVIADKYKLKDQLFFIKRGMGIVYSEYSNFGEALGYYKKALTIAEELKSDEKVLRILNNIGLLYSREKNYTNALMAFKRAYALTTPKTPGDQKTALAINISDLYNKQGNYKEARRYLDEVKDISKSWRYAQLWTINYAETYKVEGNLAKAQAILEKLIKEAGIKNENTCYVCIAELLAKIYGEQNRPDDAIKYAKIGLDNAVRVPEKIDLYNLASQLYFNKKDYVTAFQYKDSALIGKDSLSKLINRGLFESNKVKLKIQEYQNESRSYKEKQQAERTLFIISILFSLVTFFLIYRALKNRIAKQKQEKIIVDNQQKIISLELEQKNNQNLLLEQEMREKETNALLEQERLKNEIDARNRQLSAKALNLSGRNQIIEDIIVEMSKNPSLSTDPTLSKYIDDLKANLNTDEWDSFIVHFEEVNNNMLSRLQAMHPSLTPNDLRFLAYLYMNLSYKEISIILNITPIACAKRKERIASKMNIPKNVSVYSYISSI
jgi:tetratricopeptide (TPR) repeat protein